MICGCTIEIPRPEHAPPAIEASPLRSLTQAEAARHNAYGWIRPDADACETCDKKEFATPVDGFVVRECTNCQRLVCQECVDVDCDSDQDGFFTTSWTCKGGCLALDN